MCGIVGGYNIPQVSTAMYTLLHALQNRGREAAGMVTIADGAAYSKRFPGTVSANFTENVLQTLPGRIGIGHTRYSTAKDSTSPVNNQPFCYEVGSLPIAFVHNGNFTNTDELEKTVLSGVPFSTHSDSDRFFRLILREYRDNEILEAIARALKKMEGVCSGILMLNNELIAIRDSWGTRPLYWAQLGSGYVVASETCALDDLGALEWHEVPAGTLISFSSRGMKTRELGGKKRRFCSFEWVYFGFPTSEISGIHVASIRRAFGVALAKEHPIETDRVVGVPDSSILYAEGYAETLGGHHDQSLLVRKHNTGRTFIEPGQARREKAVGEKFSYGPDIRGKSITVIDDSLVRGTTTKQIIEGFRLRGAAEIHVRIGSPPVTGSCFYGISTAKRKRLLASRMEVEEICRYIGADTLEFLSLPRFKKVIKQHEVNPSHCCFACMDGKYFHKK